MYGLEQSPQQRQELQQYQLQRLEILSMSGDELSDFLDRAEAENPLIEVERDNSEIEKALSVAQWLKQRPVFESRFRDAESDEPLEPEIADPQTMTLEQFLRLQIDFDQLSPTQNRMIPFLLGCLEDNGRLHITAEQAARYSKGTIQDAAFCLELLRGLEPSGVCAESLQECLLIQLRALPKSNPTAVRLVTEHLKSLGQSSTRRLAQKCGFKESQIQDALNLIRGLEPFPGASFSQACPVYVIPDILVTKHDGNWAVQCCDKWSGSINISQHYVRLLRGSHDKANTAYLYDRLRQAKALNTAIEQRRSTVLLISQFIVEWQKDFLECRGPIRSLTLSELAHHLSYHESTLSRAIRGKYLCCPRGTYPLRKFISATIGDSNITNDELAQKIKDLVGSEDKQLPLSDQQIANRLSQSGLKISRRTIAKYRVNIGIPNAFMRRSKN